MKLFWFFLIFPLISLASDPCNENVDGLLLDIDMDSSLEQRVDDKFRDRLSQVFSEANIKGQISISIQENPSRVSGPLDESGVHGTKRALLDEIVENMHLFNELKTHSDHRFLTIVKDLFLHPNLKKGFTATDIQGQFRISRNYAKHIISRAFVRGWITQDGAKYVFKDRFEDAFKKGLSLPISGHSIPRIVVNAFKVLEEQRRQFGSRQFTKQEYLSDPNTAKSHTTATVHLEIGIDGEFIKRTIINGVLHHSFIEGAQIPPQIRGAMEI